MKNNGTADYHHRIVLKEPDSDRVRRAGEKARMRSHVLVTDDEPSIRSILALFLRKNGYRVTEAADGEEALHLILDNERSANSFDLLLTDIQMPRMSGKDLIYELKKRKISLPVLVVSGTRDMDLMDQLLKDGCRDYILKPFDPLEVEQRTRSILEVKNAGEHHPENTDRTGSRDLNRTVTGYCS